MTETWTDLKNQMTKFLITKTKISIKRLKKLKTHESLKKMNALTAMNGQMRTTSMILKIKHLRYVQKLKVLK